MLGVGRGNGSISQAWQLVATGDDLVLYSVLGGGGVGADELTGFRIMEIEIVSSDLKIDKEFQGLIPPLAAEEHRLLEENIRRDGCRDPLVVWDGILIDGHNRFSICTQYRLPFTIQQIKLENRTAAKLWIIDNQFGRRNLPDIDAIALQRKREDILRPLAKANKIESGKQTGRGNKKVLANLPEPLDTRKLSAKAAGVGERTYDAGKLILDAAEKGEIPQEDVDAIRRKEKSIHRVANDVKESRKKAKRELQRRAAVQSSESSSPNFFDNVHVGDFRILSDKVEDGSLSLIFTDPPYDRKSSDLYQDLGDFASKKLSEGGSLLTYVGHIQLAEAMVGLSAHLRYWWPICCLHSGPESLMREYGIRVGWKPVLWFVKSSRHDKSKIVTDVMSGGREKSHHDWQQSEGEAQYWISKLCPADGIVCDPFLGGGTTVAAAIRADRRWVAFEKDHDQAVLAMTRIREAT